MSKSNLIFLSAVKKIASTANHFVLVVKMIKWLLISREDYGSENWGTVVITEPIIFSLHYSKPARYWINSSLLMSVLNRLFPVGQSLSFKTRVSVKSLIWKPEVCNSYTSKTQRFSIWPHFKSEAVLECLTYHSYVWLGILHISRKNTYMTQSRSKLTLIVGFSFSLSLSWHYTVNNSMCDLFDIYLVTVQVL